MRILGDARRDATEHQAADEPPLVRPEDDEVRPFGLGRREDGLHRVAFPDEEGRSGSSRPSAHHERLGANLDAGSLLVDPSEEQAARHPQSVRIDDAQDDQVRSVLDCQRDGTFGSLLGDGRQVRGEDDLVNDAGKNADPRDITDACTRGVPIPGEALRG